MATFTIGCIYPIWGVFFGTKSLVLLRTGLPIPNIPVLRTQHGCTYTTLVGYILTMRHLSAEKSIKKKHIPRVQQGASDQYTKGVKKQKDELLPGFEPGSREDPDKPIKIPDANLYTTRARIRHSRKIFDPVKQYN